MLNNSGSIDSPGRRNNGGDSPGRRNKGGSTSWSHSNSMEDVSADPY